jgi:4-hydroxy-2-oxoheptanedioate aldolase
MTFRKRLQNRELVIGTWFTTPSVALADIICTSDIDYLIIDREHGSHSFETVLGSAVAAKANNVASVVRCTHVDTAEILRCLDVGVDGIQVPNIASADQIEGLLNDALYPPEGDRGYSVFTRNGRYGATPAKEMPAQRNEDTAIIVNVETVDSTNRMEELLAVERIDAFFIGLYDLSRSLGAPGDFSSQEFKDCVRKVTDACTAAGRSVGTICNDSAAARDYMSMGMNYIVFSVDCNIVRAAYQNFVEQARV